MSYLFQLARRNLARNPRRSVLTSVSIVAGIGLFVLGQAFVAGMDEAVLIAAEEGTVGDVLARPAKYPDRGFTAPLDKLLDVTPAARALLDAEAVAWTGRLVFSPTVTKGAASVRARAIGVDPVTDAQVFPRTLWHTDGRFPAEGSTEVGLSPAIARLLEAKPGDRVVLQVRTHPGALNALEATVSGVVTSGNMSLDAMGVWVPKSLAQNLAQADAPTHLSVKLASRAQANAFKARLATALGAGAQVASLEDETRELLALQDIRRKSLNILVFILLSLAAFGMANTFLMAAWERTREVGTLRAMGMTERTVAWLFLAEGSMVGLVASLLGAAWGGGLAAWWSTHPINLAKLVEAKGGTGAMSINAVMYTAFDLKVVALGVLVGVVVAVLASWYPARVASSLRPADAVRA